MAMILQPLLILLNVVLAVYANSLAFSCVLYGLVNLFSWELKWVFIYIFSISVRLGSGASN